MRRNILLAGSIFIMILVWFIFSPPRIWLNLTKDVDTSPATGARLVEKYGCRRCHRIGGEGSLIAPDLTGVTPNKKDPDSITPRLWLRNPKAVKSNTAMPNFHLSDSEIDAILAYLGQLDNQN